jgi:hypothetical protein
MPLEHLQLLPIVEAHDVIGLDRGPDRNSRLLLDFFSGGGLTYSSERRMDARDEVGKIGNQDVVVRYVGLYDVGDQCEKRFVCFHCLHSIYRRCGAYIARTEKCNLLVQNYEANERVKKT